METEDRNFTKSICIFSVLLAAFIAIACFLAQSREEIYISEVCAHNATIRYNPIGDYSDYVVLTNVSDSDIDLDGYSLSDDNNNLTRYTFPSVILPAGGSVTVWAEVPSATSAPYTKGELFTYFALGDLETLFLTDPQGRVTDSVRIPKTLPDQVCFRGSSRDQWEIRTAGRTAAEEAAVVSNVPQPAFSVQSGFYKEAFTLQLDAQGLEIFYTTDGSDPKRGGIPYADGIVVSDRSKEPNALASRDSISLIDVYIPEEPVDKATVIRAVARDADGTYSEETHAVYFTGDEISARYHDVCVLSVIVDPDDLFSKESGIYVTGDVWEMSEPKWHETEDLDIFYAPTNYNGSGAGWQRNAKLTLFDRNGSCLYDEDARISTHGNYARSLNQKSFNLLPRAEGLRVFDGLWEGMGDSLVLRTGGTDDMPLTNFKDPLNNRLTQNMEVGAQRSICCEVFLNGEYWGCYNLQDRLDESYIANRFGVDVSQVNLIKNKRASSGKTEDLLQYYTITDFITENDMALDTNYRMFCDMVDIDSLIDYYAAEVYTANVDAFDNNVALWRVRERGIGPYEDGKWRFLLIDTDMSLLDASLDSFTEGQCRDYNLDMDLFFSGLMKNSAFRARFRERFSYLAANDLSYERVEPVLTEFEETYSAPMLRSLCRFIDPDFTPEQYAKNVEAVRDFYRERGGKICDYMMLHMAD